MRKYMYVEKVTYKILRGTIVNHVQVIIITILCEMGV